MGGGARGGQTPAYEALTAGGPTAASFTGVGEVRFLAPDPWALATGNDGSSGVTGTDDQPHWPVAANVMFLRSVSAAAPEGREPETLVRCRDPEPETARLHDSLPPGLPPSTGTEPWLAELWPALRDATTARRFRVRGSGALLDRGKRALRSPL
ncbi:hypothetical protein C5L38_21955 [Streptomyces sp. WAC00288]|nr:hypothetical protein C5L38_21955 [Streptomyces sp. WAC00288]KYG55998.1 hypothetical protein AWI43_17610 [Streptomyces sp. WAC04657]